MTKKTSLIERIFILLTTLVLLIFAIWLYEGTTNMRYAGFRYVPANTTYEVVAFGDSLVEGLGAEPGLDFVSLLEDRLDISILNLGRRGDTTYSALLRVDQVLAFDPEVVIISLGGNDVLHSVSIEKRLENLDTIISRIQESSADVLLIGVRSGVWQDQHQEAFITFAAERDILYIPNVLEDILFNPKYLFDPIHPNNKGHELIADRIEPSLQFLLKKD